MEQETPRDLIVHSLENLSEYDFKKFKNKLSDFSFENKRSIPRGRLENADWVTTTDLLVDAYGEEGALHVVIEVLKLIGLHGPADDLQERRGQCTERKNTTCDTKFTELRKEYMKSVKEAFKRIKEHNARWGESVLLQAKYIPLLMNEGYPDREDKEREIQQHCTSHSREQRIALQAIFAPDKDGDIPKVVVLHGPAGIGKTWTSRMIMLEWTSGNFYQDKFDFVFYLSCRELNTITGKISILQLLTRTSSLQSSGDLEFILTNHGNQGRILFVIDGFDEFEWTLEEEIKTCHELHEETHKDTLLGSLLKKQLLKQSSLLITTRSLAQEKLYTFINDSRYIELKGFTDEDRRNYFYDAFENKAEKILQLIKGNNILLTMCNVPIMCWILRTVLRQEKNKDLNFLHYKTNTSIYLLYLEGLIMYHCRSQFVLSFLKKLCSLANDGVMNHKILFQEEDLERHGLSVSEVESVFLNENIFHVSIKSQTCYSFTHKTIQEFMAALYYVLEDGDVDAASEARKEASLPEICKGGSLPELYIKHKHLALAVRFLFGLLYEKQLSEFSKSTGCKTSLRVRSPVEEWITGDTARSALSGWITGTRDRSVMGEWITTVLLIQISFEVFPCLYETQNEDLIRRAMPNSSCLKLDHVWEHLQWIKQYRKELFYCLRLCECPMSLTIYMKKIYLEGLETFSPVLHKCQRLCFNRCRFLPTREKRSSSTPHDGNDVEAVDFHDTFYYEEAADSAEDQPVDLSCLINPQSRIKELSLVFCGLSPLCCETLCSVLVTNPFLIKLDLSENSIGDSGVKCLCDGLKDPRCFLQALSLQECDLTPLCCEDLVSVLITKRSLTKLDLTGNHNLEDSGVKRLCEGLIDPRCSLQELGLMHCGLTPMCCDDLYSVLVTNRSITNLDLHSNWNFRDSGVKRLCEGLSDPRCTLKGIRLDECEGTSSCCEDLYSVISRNKHLTYLKTSLRHNGFVTLDSGVSIWCHLLQRAGFSVDSDSFGARNMITLTCVRARPEERWNIQWS